MEIVKECVSKYKWRYITTHAHTLLIHIKIYNCKFSCCKQFSETSEAQNKDFESIEVPCKEKKMSSIMC